MTIESDLAPSESDLAQIRAGLMAFNESRAGPVEPESIARDAGCVAVKLDTYEFQAKPFYEKHGYVVFGVLDGYPADTRTYYLRKTL